jgi:DHA2 family methylenomycin A resistance protein-like MFS transporter
MTARQDSTGRMPLVAPEAGCADVPAGPAPVRGRGFGGEGGARLLALAAGFVMSALDATVVNVAGDTLRHRLGVSLSQLTWVVDGYTLAFAALILLSGSLADRFGAKRLYLSGMAVFLAASLACGLAPDGSFLIAARLAQGSGAALFMPSSLTLLTASFPEPERRARIVALWSSIVSASSAFGPVIGGLLVGGFGWRSIFLLNLPIGIGGMVLAARVVPSLPGRVARFAWTGHGLGVAMLVFLCFTLIQGAPLGWASPSIVASIAASVLLAGLFVRHLRTARRPVLAASLLRSRGFAAANAIGFLVNAGVNGGLYMLALFLQAARGATAPQAGAQLLPITVVFVLGNLLFARLTARIGVRSPLIAGLVLAAAALLGLTAVSASTPYLVIAALLAVGNLGVGVSAPAAVAAIVESTDAEHANGGAATMNASRQVGTLVGVALTGVVLAAQGDDWYAAVAVSFGISGGCYLLAALLAWRLPRAAPLPGLKATAGGSPD